MPPCRRRQPAAIGAAIWLIVGALLLAPPAVARAQGVEPSDGAQTDAVQDAPKTRHREPIRLYFGMWTLHLRDEAVALRNNWVIGMSARGFFGATFLNSFGHRSYTGGLYRTIVATAPRPLRASLGYRLGFVTGYDGRLMRIARKTPVLPLVQPVFSVDVLHVGVEVSYTFVVLSGAVSYRF